MPSLVQAFVCLLAFTSFALGAPANEDSWPTTRCYTSRVSTPGALQYTKWGTVYTYTKSSTSTVTKTHKARYTTTETSTTTVTETATLPLQTATSTSTTIYTSITSITSTTTIPTTVTTAVQAPFLAVQDSLTGATYNPDATYQAKRKRDVALHARHHWPHQGFPGPRQCWHYTCTTTTVTSTYTKTQRPQTSTVTQTSTSTFTSTPGATTTITVVASSTTTETSTVVATTNPATTVTIATSISPADACATNNFANYYNGNGLDGYHNSVSNFNTDVDTTAGSAADCCMAAIMNPEGQFWFFAPPSGTCSITVGNTCTAGQQSNNAQAITVPAGTDTAAIIGNALCGAIAGQYVA
ncbi:hypothetical protein BDY17DRAFT_305291 [Neohortaea acidophila]|uniref:Apple domain-containing protein n=1 Tax=Neohortaea acidophila TaxID=245834 RepID=A0A6A6PHU6_9PEZI|nr:uncharacterized protein BDY17DRAFT_305291 [Neohortaea acidophila]KAF2479284.1 hypothetical protein BDY17DRAFT_305291 [Neohortaea acidophila]